MSKAIVWFRNDLRVRDNESLFAAVNENEAVIAVYCFDPRHFENTAFGFKKTGSFRTQFLIESVSELRENLAKLNITLVVFNQKLEDILPELIEKYKIENLYFQNEWTSEEAKVERNVRSSINNKVQIKTCFNQFLFHPEDIPFEILNVPNVFTKFRQLCEAKVAIRNESSVTKSMPDSNLIENETQIPQLNDFGFDDLELDSRSAFPFKGGENQAIQRLNNYFFEEQNLSIYKLTRNGLVGTDYSTKFSAWLSNGSISAKTIYWEIKKYEAEIEKNESTYWVIFELIWRDYFKYISLKYGDSIFKIEGILNKKYEWKTNQSAINNWINGTTHEPFINANMMELKKTGWMSNRGRQNVASYFAKNLLLDWRIGAAYFESQLIDYDVHSNYGNWMYLSGVGNDPRDRKFNIKTQAENYDGDFSFQNLWLSNV